MTIEKTLYNSSDKHGANLSEQVANAKQIMQDQQRVIDENKYQNKLRRQSSKPLTRPVSTNQQKEPNVFYRGYDPQQGRHIAEDTANNTRFPVEVLSNGPLRVDSKVLGFPPKPGQSKGYIRGPMKGPEIPPVESPKKKKKKEEKKEINIYLLELIFVTGK